MTEGTVDLKKASADMFIAEVETAASMTDNEVYVFNANCPAAIRVLDVFFVKMAGAGAGDTAKVASGDGDITNAVDCNVADKTRIAAGTIDDDYTDIAAGGSLKVVTASDALVRVVILCVFMN